MIDLEEMKTQVDFLAAAVERFLFYKQTKNKHETGSNVSLGKRLTVLSKRLGRKRLVVVSQHRTRCVVSLSLLYILKKCAVFFQRLRILVGSQDLKRTK